jgi:hypothetical protein
MSQVSPFIGRTHIVLHFAVLQQIIEHLKAASVNEKREAGDKTHRHDPALSLLDALDDKDTPHLDSMHRGTAPSFRPLGSLGLA